MKVVASFPASALVREAEGPNVTVEVYGVPGGGYAFEFGGLFMNGETFVRGDGEPFATVEAAVAAAGDPENGDLEVYDGEGDDD